MRAFWKGTISFGLINIPVGLFVAARENEPRFKLLHKKDLSEIRYARICKAEEKEIPYDQIVKGVEKNGRYVVMDEKDFEKAQAEKSNAIEIVSFCSEAEIDSIYYERPYFLKPEEQGQKAYYLLREALSKTKKVAVAIYTMRKRNYVAVIKPHSDALVLNQLRFESEIVSPEDLEIEKGVKVSVKEMNMAKMLIEQSIDKFEPEQFHDAYVEGLQKTIKRKYKSAKAKPVEKQKEMAKVYDIMDLLKKSLDKKKAKAR